MRFSILLGVAAICVAQAAAAGLEFKIPPVKTSFEIKGQAVNVLAWGSVSSAPQGLFKLALTADLHDLQDNTAALLAAQLNRSDRCGERLSVESASLNPAAPAAILTARVHLERWGCVKALGREIVKRLVGGNAQITAKLTPSVSPDGISIAADVQKIDADGSLGDLLQSGSMEAAVKQKIAAAMESSIRKALDLKSTLPPAIASIVALRDVQFAHGAAGRLWFTLAGDVHISTAQFQSLTAGR